MEDVSRLVTELSGNVGTGTTPSTVHAQVASICAKVLGAEALDEDADFFDLGADSIHVTQIAARLHDVWKVDLSYMELFEHATVGRLSALVELRMAKSSA